MFYVTMTDRFMSGWGIAAGKTNKLVIACETIEQAETIERNARARREMRYINIRTTAPSYPRAIVSRRVFADMSGPWRAR